MKLLHVRRVYFVMAAVLVVSVFGAVEEKKIGSAANKPEASKTPEDGSKKVDDKGNEQTLSKPLPTVPEDLAGKSDPEIMNYTNLLLTERKSLQRRLTYHIVLTLLTTFLRYSFHTNTLVLPFIAVLQKTNDSYRGTLDADWIIHQEQLASFLWEYMSVKKIDVQKLPVSKLTGKPLLRVQFAPGKFVNLPVWKEGKEMPLPPEANVHHTWNMIKNWWNRK